MAHIAITTTLLRVELWLTPSRSLTIATWETTNLHVAIFYSPRGRETFPPKFHLIPPKFYFSPTWRIFIFHVEIGELPRGGQLFCRKSVSGHTHLPFVVAASSSIVTSYSARRGAYRVAEQTIREAIAPPYGLLYGLICYLRAGG